MVNQQVPKFPALYGKREFVTVSTTAYHLSLSRARSIDFYASPHTTSFKIHFNITLPFTLRSSKWNLSLPTKILYTFLFPTILAAYTETHAKLIAVNHKIIT